MKKESVSRAGGNGKRQRHDFEPDIAALFSEVSQIYDRTALVTKSLKCRNRDRSYADMFEVEVLLRNALRILCDAMSHLRT
jgi:hypothetical protein